MNWLLKKLTKWFFNRWYKKHPPKMVQYWKKQDAQIARMQTAADGHLEMQIKGEEYPLAGFPRGHVLLGPLAGLKKKIKDSVFNQVFAELEREVEGMKYQMLPPEKMAPSVRALWEALEAVEHAEITGDMKARIRLIRKILCFFLQEDDAYRFRFQWAMEHIDMKKVKLTKADKYHFRGKYFKVDHDRFDY